MIQAGSFVSWPVFLFTTFMEVRVVAFFYAAGTRAISIHSSAIVIEFLVAVISLLSMVITMLVTVFRNLSMVIIEWGTVISNLDVMFKV